ncbi:Regulator of nonsense transcripts 1 like protein, partial [Dictyocoela muelleri]
YGQEQVGSSGISFLNQSETDFVLQIVDILLNLGTLPENIGIITPYNAQRLNITERLNIKFKNDNSKIEVASVDSFQGKEKDYIIVSLVRSNDNHKIGFLSDKRRLNVMLTRAKYGLVLIGNPKTFLKCDIWKNLIFYYQEKGLIFEGDMCNPKSVLI